MKSTGTCPKCQGERVIHLARVADAGDWHVRGQVASVALDPVRGDIDGRAELIHPLL